MVRPRARLRRALEAFKKSLTIAPGERGRLGSSEQRGVMALYKAPSRCPLETAEDREEAERAVRREVVAWVARWWVEVQRVASMGGGVF